MIKYPHNLPIALEYVGRDIIRKNGLGSSYRFVEYVGAICKSLIKNPDPLVVPIYDFQELGRTPGGAFAYSYDMMALGVLRQSEKDIINTAINRWDRTYLLPSKDRDHSILECWHENRPLMRFLEKVFAENRYRDLHDGNIMIDLEENYRLIDIEGFLFYPLDDRALDWVRESIFSEAVTAPSTNGSNTSSIR